MLKIFTLLQGKKHRDMWDRLDEMLTEIPRRPSKSLVIATVKKWYGEFH